MKEQMLKYAENLPDGSAGNILCNIQGTFFNLLILKDLYSGRRWILQSNVWQGQKGWASL